MLPTMVGQEKLWLLERLKCLHGQSENISFSKKKDKKAQAVNS